LEHLNKSGDGSSSS
jgi:hypothetical protein